MVYLYRISWPQWYVNWKTCKWLMFVFSVLVNLAEKEKNESITKLQNHWHSKWSRFDMGYGNSQWQKLLNNLQLKQQLPTTNQQHRTPPIVTLFFSRLQIFFFSLEFQSMFMYKWENGTKWNVATVTGWNKLYFRCQLFCLFFFVGYIFSECSYSSWIY